MTIPYNTTTPETWKAIPDYEGLYEASDLGNIRRAKDMGGQRFYPAYGLLKPRVVNDVGYMQVSLTKDKKVTQLFIHRLIALTFLGIPDNPKMQVNHKNGIVQDNRLENLEWVTCSENHRHAFSELGRQTMKGERHGNAKLTDEIVMEAKNRYAQGNITYAQLASEYGVSQGVIGRAIKGDTWKHI